MQFFIKFMRHPFKLYARYKETVSNASAWFRDQPLTPVERAVWWTEYTVRHAGAPHLQSPAAEISWIEYLMLDVFLCFYLILFAVYYVLKSVIVNFGFIWTQVWKKKTE